MLPFNSAFYSKKKKKKGQVSSGGGVGEKSWPGSARKSPSRNFLVEQKFDSARIGKKARPFLPSRKLLARARFGLLTSLCVHIHPRRHLFIPQMLKFDSCFFRSSFFFLWIYVNSLVFSFLSMMQMIDIISPFLQNNINKYIKNVQNKQDLAYNQVKNEIKLLCKTHSSSLCWSLIR